MTTTEGRTLPSPPDVVSQGVRDAAEAASALVRAQSLIDDAVDPVLVELARLRMALLLGDHTAVTIRSSAALGRGLTEDKISDLALWPTSEKFSPAERACLALAEQYVIDVSNVSDADTAAVLEHLGPAGLYGFVQALYVIDESIRLDLALGGALASPASMEESP